MARLDSLRNSPSGTSKAEMDMDNERGSSLHPCGFFLDVIFYQCNVVRHVWPFVMDDDI